MKLIKIKRLSDGLFAKASGFSKRGKVWTELHHVKSHLNCTRNKYDGCVLIEYSVDEDGASVVLCQTAMETFVKQHLEARAIREAKKEEQYRRYRQEYLLKEKRRIDGELVKIGVSA